MANVSKDKVAKVLINGVIGKFKCVDFLNQAVKQSDKVSIETKSIPFGIGLNTDKVSMSVTEYLNHNYHEILYQDSQIIMLIAPDLQLASNFVAIIDVKNKDVKFNI